MPGDVGDYFGTGYGPGLCAGQCASVRGGDEMEKMTAEKLWEYCQSVVKRYGKQGQDWAFGAIEFAFLTDAITPEEFGTILEEFDLVPPGSMQRSLNCSEGKAWEEAEQ